MADFTCAAGDTRRAMQATLLGPDEKPVDLTGATVRFRMQAAGGIVERATILQEPAGGVVLFAFMPEEVATPGAYTAQFVATFPDGKTEHYPNTRHLIIRVTPTVG